MTNLEASKRFEFHIADLAKFLNKSPATLRKWEEEGVFSFPRGSNGDRIFFLEDVREIAQKAAKIGRVDEYRQHVVESLMTLVETLEAMNGATNRADGRKRIGKV